MSHIMRRESPQWRSSRDAARRREEGERAKEREKISGRLEVVSIKNDGAPWCQATP